MIKNNVINGVQVSLQELIQLRLQLIKVKLASQKRVMTPLAGGYSSFFRGRGMDFMENRHYQPGDDIRAIDWRVTARTGKPHTKLFREERERPVLFWIDYRSHMFFGTQVRFKSVAVAYAAAWLAWVATTYGDRVGGIIFSEKQIKELRPASGQRGVLRFLKALVDNQPTQDNGLQKGQLNKALAKLQQIVQPGSLVCLLSDFWGLNKDDETHIKRLVRHNDLLAVFIYDPFEKALPLSSENYNVSNDQKTLTVNNTDIQLHQLYQERFEQHSIHLETLFKQQGAHWLALATNDKIPNFLQYHLNSLWKHA